MKRRNPSIGVLMIISLTIIILTLVTRKTLCEIRFRNGSLEVTARMDVAPASREQRCGGASCASAYGERTYSSGTQLTILLVIAVAGRFQLLCGSLRFFYFTFLCPLPRVVNLADPNLETVAEFFHFLAVR